MTAVSSLPIAVGVTKQSSTSTQTVFRIGGLSLCTGATVTYTASGGSTATTSVNVVQPAVSLNITNMSLNIGSTGYVTACVTPSSMVQTVTWSIVSGSSVSLSNTSYFTVMINALSAGTSVIRATSTQYSGVYKDVTVTVSAVTGPISNGTYYIHNFNSERLLHVENGGTTDGTNVYQYAYTGASRQQWKFTNLNNGYYSIRPLNASRTMGLAVYTSYSSSIESVVIRNIGTTDIHNSIPTYAQWKIEKGKDNCFYITNRYSGKCLTVLSAGLVNMVDIVQVDNLEAASQKFKISPVSSYLGTVQNWNVSDGNVGYWDHNPTFYSKKLDSSNTFYFETGSLSARNQWSKRMRKYAT